MLLIYHQRTTRTANDVAVPVTEERFCKTGSTITITSSIAFVLMYVTYLVSYFSHLLLTINNKTNTYCVYVFVRDSIVLGLL
ncbi:hypothetical protein M0802_016846 [Mischocyttarus mexicanus]|nr:hypothetical protein M0802_016846 [Mischocyttarus mexicanus]